MYVIGVDGEVPAGAAIITAGVIELLFIVEAATTAEERAFAVVVVVGKDATVAIVVSVVDVFELVTVTLLLPLMTGKGTLPLLPPVLNGSVLLLLTLDGTNGGGNADVVGDPVDDTDVRNGAIAAIAGEEVEVAIPGWTEVGVIRTLPA